jgi:hypothetical protein|tara:strand:- start:212 stop:694 length:483 start_codon:yes stop_codon:yes gene_type:complete
MEKPLFDFITSMLYDRSLKIERSNVWSVIIESGLYDIENIGRYIVSRIRNDYMERAQKYIDAEFDELDKPLDIKLRKPALKSLSDEGVIKNKDLFLIVRECTDRVCSPDIFKDLRYSNLRRFKSMGEHTMYDVSKWYAEKVECVKKSKHSMEFYMCTIFK